MPARRKPETTLSPGNIRITVAMQHFLNGLLKAKQNQKMSKYDVKEMTHHAFQIIYAGKV